MISYEIINFLFFIKNPKIFLFLLFLQHFSLKSRSYLFFIFRKTFGNPIFFLTQKKSRPPNNTSESLDFITFFKLFAMSCFLVFYVYDFSLVVGAAIITNSASLYADTPSKVAVKSNRFSFKYFSIYVS